MRSLSSTEAGATGEDVMALAERIQKRVFELFGVKLEMEPVRLG